MPKLAVIDDDPAVLLLLRRAFHDGDVTVLTAETGRDGIQAICRERPDAALVDIRLPDMDGLALFDRLKEEDATLPVIFITASGSSDTVIQAMKRGALDYLHKPLDLAAVRAIVRRALDARRLMHTSVKIGSTDGGTDALVGRSPAMQEVYKQIGRIAEQNLTVLIRGESGTGKELVARAIYQHSPRARKPFLAINCAAIPDALLESELFGHEKGAFTGADRQRIGKFEQCHGGTLFLDEIGDMPPLLQTKMLRLLQEQRFERVGGNETIHTDVRIIAATHRDLESQIARGSFRADLYYRLNVFSIDLPPLRQRGDDLRLLIDYLFQRFRTELTRPIDGLAPAALELLLRYPWPGNVRELESTLKQAILQASGNVLAAEDLPARLHGEAPPPTSVQEFDLGCFIREALAAGTQTLYADALARLEDYLFREVLRHCAGNQAKAARTLGIARNSLRKKVSQFDITIDRTIH